jgi:hypothetical protein
MKKVINDSVTLLDYLFDNRENFPRWEDVEDPDLVYVYTKYFIFEFQNNGQVPFYNNQDLDRYILEKGRHYDCDDSPNGWFEYDNELIHFDFLGGKAGYAKLLEIYKR